MAQAEWETRNVSGEIRMEARGVAPVIRGYAILYNQLSETLGDPHLGIFREQIAPEAMTRSLAAGADLRALIDHDARLILGRLSAGSLRVQSDARGLRVEIDPPATSYGHDIVESLKRGDVSGMSFAFRTLGERWDEHQDPPVRTVTDMDVREVSVVTFPAYPQTEVAVRSLEAFRSRPTPRGRTVAERMAWLTRMRNTV